MASKNLQTHVKTTLTNFVNGLEEAINDITALEVNTMIVTEIKGYKFDPVDAYTSLFRIYKVWDTINELKEKGGSEAEFNQQEDNLRELLNKQSEATEISPELEKRYLNLGEQFYKIFPFKFEQDVQDISALEDKIDNPPDPKQLTVDLNRLLKNGRFLRKLRKLNELRSLAENEDSGKKSIDDIIFAQTVIQLDGDILSRFHQQLLEESSESRTLLLNIHKESAESGENNWREFLGFIGELMTTIAKLIG